MARVRSSVRVDHRAALARIAARLDGLSEAKINKHVARALVSARRKAMPIAKREVLAQYGVQSSALSRAFGVATGADGGGTFLSVTATVAPTSLIRFGARWSRRSAGATAQIVRGQSKTYEAAFIAPMRNGQRQVMARQQTSGGKRVPRLPIVRLTGPSAYQMLQGRDGDTAARVNAQLAEYAGGEIARQLQLVRKGRGTR